MNERTVFISRPQPSDSPFRSILEAAGWQVIGLSLIQFRRLSIPSPPPTDWIFFYSKKGVKFFLESVETAYMAGKKLACLGPGTAAALKAKGCTVDFTGTGEPSTVAEAFLKVAVGKKVLFPHARQSRQSVQSLLGEHISAISLAVYDNEARQHFTLPYCQVLVFTSPMNVAAYFKKYPIQKGQQCVAIGGATAEALIQQGLQKPIIARQPSEEAMAEAVLQLV